MKLFQKKPKDERVVAETNRIYKVGYLVLTLGLLPDLLLKSSMVGKLYDGNVKTIAISVGLEFLVFMAAQITCMVLMIRKGLSDDDAYAETDVFPWGHYIKIALLTGLAVGLLMTLLEVYAYGTEILFAAICMSIFAGAFCFIGVLLLQYWVFRMALKRRRRREAKMAAMEDTLSEPLQLDAVTAESIESPEPASPEEPQA